MKNPFVPEYTKLTQKQKDAVKLVKEKAMELYEAFYSMGYGVMDMSKVDLAKINLEQAVMWSVKAITNLPK